MRNKEGEQRQLLITISENKANERNDGVSEVCEQSKAVNVFMGNKEESFLQGRLPAWACEGNSGLGNHFFRHETNYIPHAFVWFWQRSAEASMQPTWVSLNYKATSEESANVTEKGESHWTC